MIKSLKLKSNRLKYFTTSEPASFKTTKPPENDLNGHSFTMCYIVFCSVSLTVTIRNVCKTPSVHQGTTSALISPGGLLFEPRIRFPLIGIDVDQCDNQVSDIGNSDSNGNGSTLQTGPIKPTRKETNLPGGMSNIA
jgi:hypothetical protein